MWIGGPDDTARSVALGINESLNREPRMKRLAQTHAPDTLARALNRIATLEARVDELEARIHELEAQVRVSLARR